MRVLIAEDDRRVAGLLKNRLKSDHISADVCYDGQEALELSGVVHYDVIVLDIMMPKMDGLEAVRRMRERGTDTPVLFLTARDAIEDRVGGLNAGADDYLTKPFDTRELLACINALLRRKGDQVDMLRYGNTTLDLTGYMLSTEKNSIRLSKKEFDVMRRLMQFQSRSVRKDVLLTQVWGYESNATENNVEAYVGFLRKKLKSIGSNLKIESIRLLGYHLEVTET